MESSEKENFESTVFFEGVEKLLEIWFGRHLDSSTEESDEEPLSPHSSILQQARSTVCQSIRRASDGEEDEKMSGEDDCEQSELFVLRDLEHDNDGLDQEQPCKDSLPQLLPTTVGNGVALRNKRVLRREEDLRRIPRHALESMLSLVKCEIISFKHSEHIDAYVLSESSLFVSSNRIILKTCGTTVLLRCVKPLLYLAKKYAGFDQVYNVHYSHKNFMRPDLQEKVHTNFNYEIELLESMFHGGTAYCLGRLNRDCWYYYTLNSDRPVTQPQVGIPDQTLEIIMQELDPQVMAIFTQKESASAKEATIKSGIDKIFTPEAVIDDFLFTPCGYSMNGLVKGMYYFTIHITPEAHCSFVSFETNYPQKNYQTLINKILKMFHPGKFSMTLFANEKSVAVANLHTFEHQVLPVYHNKDLQFCRFKNYDLTYGHFAKAPS